jgi:hypothetical protein
VAEQPEPDATEPPKPANWLSEMASLCGSLMPEPGGAAFESPACQAARERHLDEIMGLYHDFLEQADGVPVLGPVYDVGDAQLHLAEGDPSAAAEDAAGAVAGLSGVKAIRQLHEVINDLLWSVVQPPPVAAPPVATPPVAEARTAAPGGPPEGPAGNAPDRDGPPLYGADKTQFGKKWGKHASDYGLDPGDPVARKWFADRIQEVRREADEVRRGPYNPGSGGGDDYWFYRKGNDLVLTKPDGQFVTMYPMDDPNRKGWWNSAQKVR